MRRSKLEMTVDILKILGQKGPLKLTHLMYKTNLNYAVLSKNLVFLIKQGLVDVFNVGTERLVYSITGLGLTLLKSLRVLDQLIPVVENDNHGQPFFRNIVSVKA